LEPGTWVISDNLTIPSTINLLCDHGTILQVASGKTLTINGPFDAPLAQVFSGAGSVAFGAGYVEEIYPQWWGADGSGDDSTPVQSAATAATSKTLIISDGITYTLSDIQISADTDITGGGTLKLAVLASTVGSPVLDIRGANVTIDNIKFDGQKASQPADGFSDSFDGGASGQGRAFRAGIRADGVAYTISNLRIRNCFFENIYGACIATDDVDEVYVINNVAENCYFEIAFLYNNAGATAPLDAIVTGNRGYNIGSGDGSVNGNAFGISNYTRVIFDNNQVDTVERNLVKIEGGNQIEITNNIVINVTVSNFSGIQVQGDTTDLLIANNITKTTGKGIYVGGGGSYTYNRVKVANNICSDINGTTLGDGFACDSPINDAQIENNQFYDVQRHGIHFNHSGSRVSIKDNKLYGDGTDGDIGIYVTANGANFADLAIEGNECWNFTQSAASLGVIELRRSSTYVFTNLIMRSNKVFAGGASNRGIYIGLADIISSGIIEGNYVDGLIYLLENTANTVKVANNYTTGSITSGHITSGTVTLDTYGCTRLHSTGGAITATLPDGMEVGQIKTIVMTEASNSSTVSITSHQTSDPEVATFDAVDETGVFMWTGTEWITIFATCTFV
jgi:hypothetical protein